MLHGTSDERFKGALAANRTQSLHGVPSEKTVGLPVGLPESIREGIEEVVTAPGSPWQNPYCERLIGSIRREGGYGWISSVHFSAHWLEWR